MDPETRTLVSRIGAHEQWAKTTDRTARTAKAREARWQQYLDRVDPDRQLGPEERHRRAVSARKADLARMTLRSLQARQRRRAERLGLPYVEVNAAEAAS